MPSESETIPSRRDLLSCSSDRSPAAPPCTRRCPAWVSPRSPPSRARSSSSGDREAHRCSCSAPASPAWSAALELRDAGYRVQVLEYNSRAGGRNWTLRGGDRYTELGGATQNCGFDKGLYINPGPWRIPYHHHGMLTTASGSASRSSPSSRSTTTPMCTPQGLRRQAAALPRTFKADFQGHVAELLAKATQQGKLDDARDRRRTGRFCWMRCAPGARSTRTIATRATTVERPARLRQGSRRRPERRAGRLRARRAGRPAALAALAALADRRTSTTSRPPCSSRSAAWT